MKKFMLVLIMVVTIMVIEGCVPTLHSLYGKSRTIYDANLIGTWGEPNKSETWTVAKAEPNSYSITYTEANGKTAEFKGHLIKINKTLFMDVELVDVKMTDSDMAKLFLLPVHHIIRIEYTDSQIVCGQMDNDHLKNMLDKNPELINHELADGELLITASTEDLQKFIGEHADDMLLFKKSGKLIKH